MATVFDALVQTARALDACFEGVVTTGSGNRIQDSQLATLGWSGSDGLGGTVFLLHTATGGSPQGQSRIISDFSGSGLITTDTTFTGGSPAAGDVYGLVTRRYPRAVMVSKLNEALTWLGRVPTEDTSGSTASGSAAYPYPASVLQDVRAVFVARNATAPYDYQLSTRVKVDRGSGEIVFHEAPTGDLKIRVVYFGIPTYVHADTDQISDYVSMDWLSVKAALACARWRLAQGGVDVTQFTTLINDLMQREERARRRAVAPMPPTPVMPY